MPEFPQWMLTKINLELSQIHHGQYLKENDATVAIDQHLKINDADVGIIEH